MTEKLTALESMSAVMEKVRGLAKRDRNSQQGFNFRGIDAVMNVVGPALREVGAVITPRILTIEQTHGTSKSGGTLTSTRVTVEYTWHGPDGSTITGAAPGEAFDSGDKGTAKAMSVAYRTFLLQALTLPTDEPDPDAHTYDAPPRTEADAARDELMAVLQQNRLAPAWAADQFKTATGGDLNTSTDAQAVRDLTTTIQTKIQEQKS